MYHNNLREYRSKYLSYLSDFNLRGYSSVRLLNVLIWSQGIVPLFLVKCLRCPCNVAAPPPIRKSAFYISRKLARILRFKRSHLLPGSMLINNFSNSSCSCYMNSNEWKHSITATCKQHVDMQYVKYFSLRVQITFFLLLWHHLNAALTSKHECNAESAAGLFT